MPSVNFDEVLYGNPTKKLMIAHEELKKNYNEETAKEYCEAYVGQPLSFILDNSRKIFSESFYGAPFYTNLIENAKCAFPFYESEHDKVLSFLEDNRTKLTPEQVTMYESLAETIAAKKEEYKNSILVCEYAKENGLTDETIISIADTLYDRDNFAAFEDGDRFEELNDRLSETISTMPNSAAFLLYAPYIREALNDVVPLVDGIEAYMPVAVESSDEWTTMTTSILLANKLSHDTPYRTSVKSMPATEIAAMFESYMEADLNDVVSKLTHQVIPSEEVPPIYEEGTKAINSILDNEIFYEAVADNSEDIKEGTNAVLESLNDVIDKLIYLEYATADDTTAPITGYDFFSEGTTIDECMQMVVEATVPVVPKKPLVKPTKSTTKPVNPKKNEDFSVRVQNKAMDFEAKQTERIANAKRKGSNIGNAIRAIANIPKNIIEDIKGTARVWDKADEERRKKYMTEPGFRKKAFRNAKLACMYGAAAHIKLALIPVLAFGRHLSKERDRRVRNDTIREVQTELNIVNEKINDASANGDQKEKYQLMRIKSQLEAELVRLKLNSKYV